MNDREREFNSFFIAVKQENGEEKITHLLLSTNKEKYVHPLFCHLSKQKLKAIELKLVQHALSIIQNLIDLKPSEVISFWKQILCQQYVVNYAGREELKQLIEIIIRETNEPKTSIWSCYILGLQSWDRECQNGDIFLHCLFHRLGVEFVEKLVVEHEDGHFMTNVIAQSKIKNMVDALLLHLPEDKQQEIERKFVNDAPPMMQKLLDDGKSDVAELCWKNILTLVKHIDTVQLKSTITIITKYKLFDENQQEKREDSVWSRYLINEYNNLDLRIQKVKKFLECVSKKLGKVK